MATFGDAALLKGGLVLELRLIGYAHDGVHGRALWPGRRKWARVGPMCGGGPLAIISHNALKSQVFPALSHEKWA